MVAYMKSKADGNEGNVTLELDISKAYDRINWTCLKEIIVNNDVHGNSWLINHCKQWYGWDNHS